MRISELAFLLAALACMPAFAAPCEAPAHRQFDFWLGSWEVVTPDGRLAGHNTITVEYGGCVLHERYTTPTGYTGESLNAYDSGRGIWHQTWVDNAGTLLLLEGGLDGADMVLEGSVTDAQGSVTRHRIRWTPNADGTVRQHWQSADASGDWQTLFDGLYRPHPSD